MFNNILKIKSYVTDKFNNSYYYFGNLYKINNSIPYLPFYNLSSNNFLIIQWRYYDSKNDIHRSQNSETIIYDINSFIHSFHDALNINDNYWDSNINLDNYKNYHIYVKIVRNDLGYYGMIDIDTYYYLHLCNLLD